MKYDGYQLRLERDGNRVRLITRGGYDWSDRFPWIVEAALKNRFKQFVIDGELEGLVSKRADRPYRAGRSKDWVKVKNRRHPAYRRVQDQF